MTVEVSGPALADLDEIFNYYQEQREGLGQEFITEFHAAAERIGHSPAAGRQFPSALDAANSIAFHTQLITGLSATW